MTLERALLKAISMRTDSKEKQKATKSLPEHLKLGVQGENSAAEYIISRGYTVLARNVNYRFGEIDIVARENDEIVFVEVRTRSVGYILPADRTVGPDKLKKLMRAANIWVENNQYSGFWRIDLIAITIDVHGNEHLEHIKDITEGIK